VEVINMRIKVYFGVLGSEIAIKAFSDRAAMERSVIKEMGSRRSEEQKCKEPGRWIWRTNRASIDAERFEEELEAFVVGLLALSSALESIEAGVEERVVTVIIQADDVEPRPNILLSRKTIQALASLDAALDVDNVSVME